MVSTSRKKVLSKKQYFFFWTEKCVPTGRDEERLEKYLMKWKKMVSTS